MTSTPQKYNTRMSNQQLIGALATDMATLYAATSGGVFQGTLTDSTSLNYSTNGNQLTVNSYAPTGGANAVIWEVLVSISGAPGGTANVINLTGIAAPPANSSTVILYMPVALGNSATQLVLQPLNSGSPAANQFLQGCTLSVGESIILIYDATNSGWTYINGPTITSSITAIDGAAGTFTGNLSQFANTVDALIWGAGGGGGAGYCAASGTISNGGAGGNAGGVSYLQLLGGLSSTETPLNAAIAYSVTTGAGGTGGVGAVQGTAGSAGGQGGTSSVSFTNANGTFTMTAVGGSGGAAGSTTSGGIAPTALPTTGANLSLGALGGRGGDGTGLNLAGAAIALAPSPAPGYQSSGGGGGGGITSTTVYDAAGGSSGASQMLPGVAGGAASHLTASRAGTAGNIAQALGGSVGGGGGGCFYGTTNVSGGAGGAGKSFGAGGGGGGSSIGTTASKGGNGGVGAPGAVVIRTG